MVTGAVAERLHLIHKPKARERREMGGGTWNGMGL